MERKMTKSSGATTREQRLKAALKANLGRRKAQAKGRDDTGRAADDAVDDTKTHDKKES